MTILDIYEKVNLIVPIEQRAFFNFFEDTVKLGTDPKEACNWVNGMILSYLNYHLLTIDDIYMTPDMLHDLIKLIDDKTISSKQAKQVFYKVVDDKKDPLTIIDELGIKQTSDDGAIRDIVKGILDNNAKLIEEYKGGRNNVLDFFVGQVMKATRGQANPMMTSTIIKEEIEKR